MKTHWTFSSTTWYQKDLYSPPTTPKQKNRNITLILKDYIHKFSINGILQWNQLFHMQQLYNWFPNQHSQESPHFGCDPYLPKHATFLQPQLRYLGVDEGMTDLDKLWQTYMFAAVNTKEAQSKQKCDKHNKKPKFKISNLILITNLDKKVKLGCKICSQL